HSPRSRRGPRSPPAALPTLPPPAQRRQTGASDGTQCNLRAPAGSCRGGGPENGLRKSATEASSDFEPARMLRGRAESLACPHVRGSSTQTGAGFLANLAVPDPGRTLGPLFRVERGSGVRTVDLVSAQRRDGPRPGPLG